MSAILCRRGVIVDVQDVINNVGQSNYLAMKKTFMRRMMLEFNKFRVVKLVQTDPNNKNILIIPRFLAFNYLEKGYITSIKNILPQGENINIDNFACVPYPVQTIIHDKIIGEYFDSSNLEKGSAGVVCELEAGLGKTFLAAQIINTLKKKTLYVVPSSEFLLQQAYDDLRKCFPTLKIGFYYGKKKIDGDIVIAIVNSLQGKTYKLNKVDLTAKEFFSRFGLTIFDETHEYCTDERSKVFINTNTPYMLGITAEANNREDKCDFIAHYHVGPVLYSDKFFTMDKDERYKSSVQIVRYNGPEKYTQNLINEGTGMMSMCRMVRQISQDHARIQLIIDHTRKLYDAGHNLFIWCDMRASVKILYDILKDIFDGIAAPEIKPIQSARDALNESEIYDTMVQMISKNLPELRDKRDASIHAHNMIQTLDNSEREKLLHIVCGVATVESSNLSPDARAIYNLFNSDDDDSGGDSGDDSGDDTVPSYLMGGCTAEDIYRARDSRLIIATYQYAYRGVSLPKFDAMIFATPRKAKIYQTLKRIFRMGGDLSIERKIVDIVDNKTKLKSQLSKRKKQYDRPLFDATITEAKIKYDDIVVANKTLYDTVIKKHIDVEFHI